MDKRNPLDVHVEEKLFYQGSHIPTKQWRRFSKGQSQIEGRLDLHGFTRYDAMDTIDEFIEDCQEAGKQVVLIIHGRGEVLKSVVDQRLRELSAVLAFISATPKHGGMGAVYVLLKMQS